MKYIRSENCECKNYFNFDDLSNRLKDRSKINEYWLNGFIHTNGKSKECTCHKYWRLSNRYSLLAEKYNLPNLETLEQLNYQGDQTVFNKLQKIPNITSNEKYKDTIFYITGKPFTQKTTSISKLIYRLFLEEKYPDYYIFNDILNDLLNDTSPSLMKEIKDSQFLIIDDCFEADIVNFKACYNNLLTTILNRKNPTILISSKQLKDLENNSHYSQNLIQSLEERISFNNSIICFNDNINNILLKEKGPIDLWNL